jgi:hypothetical protein
VLSFNIKCPERQTSICDSKASIREHLRSSTTIGVRYPRENRDTCFRKASPNGKNNMVALSIRIMTCCGRIYLSRCRYTRMYTGSRRTCHSEGSGATKRLSAKVAGLTQCLSDPLHIPAQENPDDDCLPNIGLTHLPRTQSHPIGASSATFGISDSSRLRRSELKLRLFVEPFSILCPRATV